MTFINAQQLETILQKNAHPADTEVSAVLAIGALQKGLSLEQVAILLNTEKTEQIEQIKKLANEIKQSIYGNRLVLFAPIYLSSYCVNNCAYCAFHVSNTEPRRKLTLDEIEEQTKLLIQMGHKRLLVEAGEDPIHSPIDYVVSAIEKIYATKSANGEIRRVNVNIAATSTEDYKKLKAIGIGTYQLFQETYHEPTYKALHHGPKADFERQLYAHDKAFAAGIDDLGIGALFGLYNFKFEVLALLRHAEYMNQTFGVGPHTISVPRFRPAQSVTLETPHHVNDSDFLKLIAVLRIAVPYTGMIISTRETPEMRRQAFELGISQTSAASCTSPGGYGSENPLSQFETADHRPLAEVMDSLLAQGILPSFCTACYRVQRTGERFMSIAKRGEIHEFCLPNAILTFQEYCEDYLSLEKKANAESIIARNLLQIPDSELRIQTQARLERIKNGVRDLYF